MSSTVKHPASSWPQGRTWVAPQGRLSGCSFTTDTSGRVWPLTIAVIVKRNRAGTQRIQQIDASFASNVEGKRRLIVNEVQGLFQILPRFALRFHVVGTQQV